MATIKTAISLYDGVTGPMRSMVKVMDTVISTFERMGAASNSAINVGEMITARAELTKLSGQMDTIERSIASANERQKQLNQSFRNGTSAADGLLQKVKNLAVAYGGTQAVSKLVGLSDQLTGTKARLNFLVDDGGSVAELESQIMASAQRSRSYYLDTASAIATMGANAGAAFSGNDELIAFMEQVNKQFVIGGASAQGQSAAMLQLTQAMAAGALRGEELNSILDNAPGIARAIESYMGIAEGSIKQYAEQGLITSEVVKNALFAAADEVNAKFESMPMTWAQAANIFKNSLLSIFSPVLDQINAIANSADFQTMLYGILDALAGVANIASMVISLLTAGASFIISNWDYIGPMLMGIVTALIAVSAAQAVVNAVMAANPVMLIVIGIGMLIGLLYAAAQQFATMTGVASSGFGVITGGINVVIQFFVNLGLTVANIALGIWNAMCACAENIGIAFHNTIAGVQSWFYNLLSTALTVVAGLCEALNQLPFVEFDYSGITGQAQAYANKAAEAEAGKKSYVNVGDAFSAGLDTFDAFSSGWASDAFNAGSSWGDGVMDKVFGIFDAGSMDFMGAFSGAGGAGGFDYSGALANTAGNTADTAANTAKAANALDIAQEDLAYMKDIAEREAINRYTTAEIVIHQNNENHIGSDLDLDGIMTGMTERIIEEVNISADGDHIS